MAGSIKGITVEIGGDTTGLSKALTGINKNITNTQKQLKEVEKLLKLDPKNTELLEQKQRLLGDAIEQTSTKLGALKQAEAEAQKQFQKGDLSREEYEKLQRQIIATEQKLQGLTTQTSKTKKAFDNISKSSEDFAGKLDSLSGKLAPITAGVLGLGAAAIGTVEGTEELRSDLSKLDQNASDHKVSVDAARKAWEDFAIASDETDSAVEATSNLLQAGFTESNLQKAVENLTGAYIRFPDTLKIESLADSLQETLATGEATGQFGELLDRLGISTEDFAKGLSECKTEAEKQNYALETLSKAGLADTYNGWKETNSELVESKKANLDLQKSLSKLADTVQPIMTDIVDAISDMVDWFNELSPETKEATVKILAFSAALSPITKIAANVTKGVSNIAGGISKLIKPTADATTGTGFLSGALKTLSGIPGGGLLAAFAGLSIAFGTYLANVDTATKRTREYIQGIRDMQTANQEAVEAAKESACDKLAEVEMTKEMATRVLELTNAQTLDNQQKSELAGLITLLNDQYPDLNLQLDEQGRLTATSAKNLEDYIKNLEQSIKIEALRGVAVEQYRALYDAENNLKSLRDQELSTNTQLKDIEQKLFDLTGMTVDQIGMQQLAQGNLNFVNAEARGEVAELINSWRGLKQSSDDLSTEIENQSGYVEDLRSDYKTTMSDMVNSTGTMEENVTTDFGDVGTEANDMSTEVGKGADGTETEVSDMATNINDTLNSIDGNKVGTNLATGMSNGIKNNSWKVSDEAKKMMQGVEDAINANPKFKSLAKSVGIQGFADGGTLTSGLAVVGEEGPEWLSVQSGRATVIPMTTRQRQAVQGSGGNTVHVGITINNGQFTTADAKRVARMVNKELGMAYR